MSDPNTHATAAVKNSWGSGITEVMLHHRYDEDHFDNGSWNFINNGDSGSPPLSVGYNTGTFRTGKDYWSISFKDDKGATWQNKPNFYCFLTKDDANQLVVCEVKDEKLYIKPAKSSSCTVSLYRVG
jgi:Up-Regulated in long-lived daf-2